MIDYRRINGAHALITLAGYTARADAFMSRLLELDARGRPLQARTCLAALPWLPR